jgi:hypothetical protein
MLRTISSKLISKQKLSPAIPQPIQNESSSFGNDDEEFIEVLTKNLMFVHGNFHYNVEYSVDGKEQCMKMIITCLQTQLDWSRNIIDEDLKHNTLESFYNSIQRVASKKDTRKVLHAIYDSNFIDRLAFSTYEPHFSGEYFILKRQQISSRL